MNHCSQDQQCVCVCVSLTSSGILQGGCISRLIFLKWKMRTYAIKSPRMTTQATGTTTATEISAWFNSCSGKNTQKRQFMKKNYVFLDKKTQKVSRGPEWRGGKQYEEGTQRHSGEKKSKWKKKPVFSEYCKKKLKFFYHFKKKFFPQEDENI